MNQEFMKTKRVVPLVISMSLPMMLSMLINSLYNIIDSMFVAKIGEHALTAVSLVYPLQMLVTSVGVGFGIGINAASAFYLGSGDKERANKAASQGLLLSGVHGIILSVCLGIGAPFFLRLFTQEADILFMGQEYAVLVFVFSVVVTLQIAMEKIYQSVGNMLVPMVCMAVGCITNIILDPIFIFGLGPVPRMEVTGAAVATVIGQAVTLLLYVIWYLKKDMGLKLCPIFMKPEKEICKKLYLVGAPSALNMGLPSLLIIILNGIAAAFSPVYILILGVYFKLQSFIYLPANGIVQGMRPILSYNYGAGEKQRMKQIIKICTIMIMVIMGAGMLLFLLIPGEVMALFTADADTIKKGVSALRIISLGFVVSGVSVICCGALESLGLGIASFVISSLRYLVIIVPAALIGSRLAGINGVWAAFPAAEGLTAIAAIVIFLLCYRKQLRKLEDSKNMPIKN